MNLMEKIGLFILKKYEHKSITFEVKLESGLTIVYDPDRGSGYIPQTKTLFIDPDNDKFRKLWGNEKYQSQKLFLNDFTFTDLYNGILRLNFILGDMKHN